MVAELLGRDREILTRIAVGVQEAGSVAGFEDPDPERAIRTLGAVVGTLLTGLLSGLSSATVVIVGGVTLVGIMNGVVIGLGAALLGVPLVLPIALVNSVTSYIPFFGAFIAGAFAVLIALGANGLSTALAMLAVTLLANNTLQNLFEPLAFGKTLRLHPLVVMLVTTAGTLLFGLLGATLAAPVTAVALRIIAVLREAGLFAQGAAKSGRSKAPA